jgi:hypothetical protein
MFYIFLFSLFIHTDDSALQEIINARRALTRYHAVFKVVGSATLLDEKYARFNGGKTKSEYSYEIEVFYCDGKYYQTTKYITDRPEQSSNKSICKGCTSDGRVYHRNLDNRSAIVDARLPDIDNGNLVHVPSVGLSGRSIVGLNDSDLLHYLKSDRHGVWTQEPVQNPQKLMLTRKSLTRNGFGSIIIDTANKVVDSMTYKLDGKEIKSFKNRYGRHGYIFPEFVSTHFVGDKFDITEQIDVVVYKPNPPASYFDFSKEKAGIRYNARVTFERTPEELKNPKYRSPPSYWDGNKFVHVLPDPSEYIPGWKPNTNTQSQTPESSNEAPQPALVPVQVGGFPWRMLLLIVAAGFAVVALVFAVRGARPRR